MMYEWTEEIISYMKDASSYSGYFDFLAKTIYGITGDCKSVCDAGCGLGQLAVSLSHYYPSVTGIDINTNALNVFKEQIQKENLANVFAVKADLLSCVPDRRFDLMVFNYFGDISQILNIKERFKVDKIVVVKRNYEKHRFSISNQKLTGHNRQSAFEYLSEQNIPFKEFSFSHEFGQPFKTLEDAVRFFEIYSHDTDKSLININNVKSRLKQTNDSKFPYYLEQIKDNRIFLI